MTIAEMVHIRNEIAHVEAVLHYAKNEGYQYGSRESAERSIKRWEVLLEFWKNELKDSAQNAEIPHDKIVG